jgi:hypothetical protein
VELNNAQTRSANPYHSPSLTVSWKASNGLSGRPCIDIDPQFMQTGLDFGQGNMARMAKVAGVSTRTLRCCAQDAGLLAVQLPIFDYSTDGHPCHLPSPEPSYSELSNAELNAVVANILN